jgi:predicted amidohydrolase YtcJ
VSSPPWGAEGAGRRRSRILLEHVELSGREGAWVCVEGDTIRGIGWGSPPPAELAEDALRLDGRGGALLPGLHDHHVHLFATAARDESLFCGGPEVASMGDLVDRLHRAAHEGGDDGWLRAVGWDEDRVGWPDRHVLDRAVPGRPLRLQHRTGAMWVLNTAGLAAVGLLDRPETPRGVELDQSGRPTGRLRGLDRWLRERWRADVPSLGRLGEALASRGVTGVTDATAHNGEEEVAAMAGARRRGELPQRVMAMTSATLDCWPAEVSRGPVKIVLEESALPNYDELVARIVEAHRHGTRVAVHTLERSTTVFAARAVQAAGGGPGDRLEHAALLSDELLVLVADGGLTVVTQPHFVAERGAAYRRHVDPLEQPWLYRCASLQRAGVSLAAGSDAPVGTWDPWSIMVAAVRGSDLPEHVRPDEQLDPEAALALFTGAPDAPGTRRGVTEGARADMCLLDRPWQEARRDLADVVVRATLVGGEVVHFGGG